MAANALANIAAATAAGYVLERYTLPNGTNITKLSKKTSGAQGREGQFMQFVGEASTSGAADTASLTNLNRWRDNRYGADSASANLSPISDSAASPSTQGIAPTHRSMVKDRD